MQGQVKKARAKILLIGKNGQVGRDLHPRLGQYAEIVAPDRRDFDLCRPEDISTCVRAVKPGVIVNAAAYTAVDKAESEPEMARAVNAIGPGLLAQEAKKLGALLIHYSTDYVFDGAKPAPYVETDPVNPLNTYGKTKLEGEEAIRSSGCEHLIFRTSWVYGLHGSNFLLTMLRLGRERDELRIVTDQIGAPTSSAAIARATQRVLETLMNRDSGLASSGTYHMTASDSVSWFGFASAIFGNYPNRPELRLKTLLPIPTSGYPTPAQRPLNSRLHCSKLKDVFETTMAPWQDELSAVMMSLTSAKVQNAGQFQGCLWQGSSLYRMG